jgi:hypothetical protein
LIATLTLKGEIFERHVPQDFQTLVRGNGAPERSVERAVIVMDANHP